MQHSEVTWQSYVGEQHDMSLPEAMSTDDPNAVMLQTVMNNKEQATVSCQHISEL